MRKDHRKEKLSEERSKRSIFTNLRKQQIRLLQFSHVNRLRTGRGHSRLLPLAFLSRV